MLPPIAPFAHTDFRGHMAQHMLIGMYAPLALVLGAPAFYSNNHGPLRRCTIGVVDAYSAR